MSSQTPTLINQTFVEKLSAEQVIAVKEFADFKDESMVFNYLWHIFPEIMTTKNQDHQLLRQKIGDSEFARILKAAKRFYGFRFYGFLIVTVLGFAGALIGGAINSGILAFISILSCGLGFPCVLSSFHTYFYPFLSRRS